MYASQDANIPNRRSNLPLPNLISLDDFAASMTPQCFDTRSNTSYYVVGACPERGKNPFIIEQTSRRPIDHNESGRTLSQKNNNTAGPMTLTSGYGSNTFPYSAAHVLDLSTLLYEIQPINSNRVVHDKGLFNTSCVAPKYSCFTHLRLRFNDFL